MDAIQGSGLDMSKLSDAEKRDLQQFVMNESQKIKIQQTVHTLTDMCFKKTITGSFRSGKLDRTEEANVQNCVDRFMDANMLVIKNLEQMRTG